MGKMLLLTVVFLLATGIAAQAAGEESSGAGPADTTQSAVPSQPDKPYTSVIIDATGYKLDRCMSPKIRKTDGSEVWGTVKVDVDYVEEHGIVGYAKSIDEARKCPRAGSNPMVIQAIGLAGGNFHSDPVVSNADAELLLKEDAKGDFLSKFNVIFVKDGKL